MRLMSVLFVFIVCLGACQNRTSQQENESAAISEEPMTKYLGSIEVIDDRLRTMIASDARMEILGDGHEWTEGPVWIPSHQMLLYSDIPQNSIFKWRAEEGTSLFLKPSGFTGEIERKGEPGSNGLLLNALGQLVLCQHGDRRVARYTGNFDHPQPSYETIIAEYEGRRFNSPNDACYAKDQTLFFTDPPYGLEGNMDDPAKELDFQGVYRLDPNNKLTLLTDQMSRPNGIALSPDETTLYVANSDPKQAIWMVYDLDENKNISNGRVFYDATDQVGKEKGLPDGLKVHPNGNVFATGPGGVWIFTPEGEVLGKLKTGQATANCAFNDSFSTLFITADMYLARLDLGST